MFCTFRRCLRKRISCLEHNEIDGRWIRTWGCYLNIFNYPSIAFLCIYSFIPSTNPSIYNSHPPTINPSSNLIHPSIHSFNDPSIEWYFHLSFQQSIHSSIDFSLNIVEYVCVIMVSRDTFIMLKFHLIYQPKKENKFCIRINIKKYWSFKL